MAMLDKGSHGGIPSMWLPYHHVFLSQIRDLCVQHLNTCGLMRPGDLDLSDDETLVGRSAYALPDWVRFTASQRDPKLGARLSSSVTLSSYDALDHPICQLLSTMLPSIACGVPRPKVVRPFC